MIFCLLLALVVVLWNLLEPTVLFLACAAGFTWTFHWLFSLRFR